LTCSNARELEQSRVVHLDVDPRDSVEGAPSLQLFLKRANVEWLRRKLAKSVEKWAVSARSFENERRFLLTAPALSMRSFSVPIPRCLGACVAAAYPDAVEGEEAWLDRTFMTLTERLPAALYFEHRALDKPHTMSALTYLARFHAFFWEVEGHTSALDASTLFAPGCWWRANLRPNVRFSDFSRILADLCEAFPGECGHLLATPQLRESAEWIGASTASISRATSDGEGPWRTLLLGDYKTSNLLWARDASPPRCTSIDFQWTGRGRSGMGDVVYLLTSGVRYDVLEGLDALLDHYHAQLMSALSERLGFSPEGLYPLPAVRQDWGLEVVDYAKTALPYLLDGLTPSLAQENVSKYGWLTCEDDPRCTAWLVGQALDGAVTLRERESAGLPLGWCGPT